MAFELFKQKYFHAGACTDPGLARPDNQDSYRCCPGSGLFAVSDGMGGGEGGGRASAMVAQFLGKAALTPLKELSAVVKFAYQANAEIGRFAAENNLRGMGATLVGLLLSPFDPGAALLFSAGDSRCYLLRQNKFVQLTSDHTIATAMGVAEETLAKHLQGVLTNAAGCGAGFFVEERRLEISAHDRYLLCSDGIYRQVPEAGIKAILGSGVSAEEKAKALVAASLKHGGVDNATAVVIEFGELAKVTDEVRREEAECPDVPEEEGTDDGVTPPTE